MTNIQQIIVVSFLILVLLIDEHCAVRRDKQHRKHRRRRTKLRFSDERLKHLLSSSAANFSLNIYKTLSPDYSNFVFSPIGVQMALSMAYLPARASTARELQTSLQYMQMRTPRNVHTTFRHFTDSLKHNIDNVTLKFVNVMYVRKSVSLRNRFVRKMRRFYKARVKTFTFHPPFGPEMNINKWIKKRTQNKIRKFLPPQSVKRETVLMLMNSMYFKGTWREPVEENNTAKSSFKINRFQSISVDMMNIDSPFRSKYSSELRCKSLELPYAGNRFSFFVILPNQGVDLQQLESRLTTSNLDNLLNITTEPSRMRVRIPKLKLENLFKLKDVLRKVGFDEVFKTGSADLTGINGKRRSLHVDDVAHKSCVVVDERGSNGVHNKASITDSNSKSPSFYVDRPFMFIIRDNIFQINIFMGKFVNPSR